MLKNKEIAIVSGLPRSGTSMLMSMISAGGIPVLADGIREADEDNPKGYFELEAVKKTKEDKSWMENAGGKVVKMISQLLLDLPTDDEYTYKVVFIRRNIDEILASQKKMLIRRGTYKPEISDAEMKNMFLLHIEHIVDYLRSHKCFETLYVNYNLMLTDPTDKIPAINTFLGGELDTEAMAATVDQQLYRNRK